MRLTVRVLASQWAWSDPDEAIVLAGGDHALPSDDVKLTADLARAIACGVMAGALEVLEADPQADKAIRAAVERHNDSLKAQARAVADGRWQEGNLAAFDLDVAAGARSDG